MCVSAGLPAALSKFIVCQAVHETGNFTSGAFRDDHNLFGYSKVVGGKWQGTIETGHGEGGVNYAYYTTVENSINEIIDYYKRRINEGYKFNDPSLTIPVFASELKRAGYYGDTVSNYTAGITRAYNSILLADIRATLDGVVINLDTSKKNSCPYCGHLLQVSLS